MTSELEARAWWRRLLDYARPERRSLLTIGLLSVVMIAINTLRPWPLKLIVDDVLRGRRLSGASRWIEDLPAAQSTNGLLAWLALATVLLIVCGAVVLTVQQARRAAAGARMRYALGADLFHHAQRLSLRFHQRRSTGDLAQRIGQDTSCVQTLTIAVALPLIEALVTLAVMFTVMVRLDPVLAVVSLFVVLPLGVLVMLFLGRMASRSYAQYELEGQMMALAEQALTALPVVQAFGREELEVRRFRALSRSTVSAHVRASVSQLQFGIAAGGVMALGTAVMMGIGGTRVLDGQLTMGELLVFLSYLASLYAPLEILAAVSAGLAGASASSRRVFEILDAEEEVRDRPGAVVLSGPSTGHVRFEEVTFGYDTGRPVLHGIDLEARPGETIALVGRTGAGKSTLVSLIPRFSDPWSGRVTLDGADLRGLSLASLRDQISVVLQEPFLLPMSIADNIAYGRPDATRDQIAAAADAANATEFIDQLPDGLDTVIGERGATLSGGQRQRISIARALVKDAPVLVLDEPTSALDSETEALLLDALRNLMAGRTTFIIAHRLSTIRQADRIAVLDHGHLVEHGTHDDLIHQPGIYQRLHHHQQVPA